MWDEVMSEGGRVVGGVPGRGAGRGRPAPAPGRRTGWTPAPSSAPLSPPPDFCNE